MRWLLAVLASLALWGCDVRPGDYPEPSPPGYAGRGPAPETTVLELPSVEEITQFCQANGVKPREAFSILLSRARQRFEGCYVPASRTEVVPAQGVVPEDRRKAIIDHENAHSWGWVHPANDRGWVMPKPAGNLFAGQAVPPVNMFQGR